MIKWKKAYSILITNNNFNYLVNLVYQQQPLLQAGGHGTCITQCRSAKIVTSKTIPMQVDGEACKVKPSIIEMSLLNKAVMLAKKKPGRTNVLLVSIELLCKIIPMCMYLFM